MANKQKPETLIKRACSKLIKDSGGYSLPIPGGAYGISGAPDRIVFYKGRAYAVEFKAPGRKLGPAQEKVRAAIELTGCPYLVIRSVEEMMDALGITRLFAE